MPATPEQLLTKLTRRTAELRRYLWLAKHQGEILWVDGQCTVTTSNPLRYGRGKSLDEALAAIETETAERERQDRLEKRWLESFPTPPSLPHSITPAALCPPR